jgi:hypothetical protein
MACPGRAEPGTARRVVDGYRLAYIGTELSTGVPGSAPTSPEWPPPRPGCLALAEPLVLMTTPFAPDIAEELWAKLGHPRTLAYEPFPEPGEALAAEQVVTLPGQIDSKTRFRVQVPARRSGSRTLRGSPGWWRDMVLAASGPAGEPVAQLEGFRAQR